LHSLVVLYETNVLSLISQCLNNYYQLQTNATVATVATCATAAPILASTKRGVSSPSPRFLLLPVTPFRFSSGPPSLLSNQRRGSNPCGRPSGSPSSPPLVACAAMEWNGTERHGTFQSGAVPFANQVNQRCVYLDVTALSSHFIIWEYVLL